MADDEGQVVLKESVLSQAHVAQQRLKSVTGLYVAVKNARIFAPGNDVSVESIRGLLASIRDILEADGVLVLRVVHNYLLLNDVRVKADLATMACYSFVLDELQRLKIGAVSFTADVEEEELGLFVCLLAGFEVQTRDPFTEFREELVGSGVGCVVVDEEVEV